jgi:HD-GYP domain-containing protein (c-di-GMP phosphodiesterase class II)
MQKDTWIAIEARQLPLGAILSFPVMVAAKKDPELAFLPGSIISKDAKLLQKTKSLFVAKHHLSHLAFYQHSSFWHYEKPEDFDRFVIDYLNSILFRIFNFKKVDNYTFIALYDFVDRFRFAWQQDMPLELNRLMAAPSSWHLAFRYRVYVALSVVLLARRMGYEGFYDLIDHFLGALFCDIGHFKLYKDLASFTSASPHHWFFEKGHPEESLLMLSDIEDLPRAVKTMVVQHHEAVDGTGFPKGLKGSVDISDQAQMVGILGEYIFGIHFGLGGTVNPADKEGTVQSAKNFLLKQRQRYSPDVYSAFTDLSSTLFIK